MTQRTLIINGIPVCFGEIKPDWFDGDLLPLPLERVKLSHQIDPMGGVEQWDDVDFRLVDVDNKLAKYFRFFAPSDNIGYVISPNPLPYDYSGSPIEISSDTHLTKRCITTDTDSSSRCSANSKLFDNLYDSWSVVFWSKAFGKDHRDD